MPRNFHEGRITVKHPDGTVLVSGEIGESMMTFNGNHNDIEIRLSRLDMHQQVIRSLGDYHPGDYEQAVKNYRTLKNQMFVTLYGGGDPWKQGPKVMNREQDPQFVGKFNQVTEGGAHRLNYVFDLEDQW